MIRNYYERYFSTLLPKNILTLKASITTAADNKFRDMFPNFEKNKVIYYMRIMKYHALFVVLRKRKN